MKLLSLFFALLSITAAILYIFFGEKVQVFQPKGIISKQILDLILFNLALMVAILLPTFIWLLFTVWKYRASHTQSEYKPEKTYGKFNQCILWLLPSCVVFIMALHTWKAAHQLDPYKRMSSPAEELVIQVVAIDWKWLFIYPQQEIACVNFVQFPEKTPIRFELTADGSPMNSFWIPSLSGQIYCMTGMVTPLHLNAEGVGTYTGKAAEINGEGYAKMNFVVVSSTENEFDDWVNDVRESHTQLDHQAYAELLKPSIDHPQQFYSSVEKDLFNTIVMKVNSPI
jgi:cytochrome o ubiquinol oxidase subunit II